MTVNPGWWLGLAFGALLSYGLGGLGPALATIIVGLALVIVIDYARTGRW